MSREKKKLPKAGYPVMVLVLVAAIGAGLWMGRRADRPTEAPTLPSSTSTTKTTPAPTPTAPTGDTPKQMTAAPTPEVTVPPPLPKEDEDKLHLWLTESETPADAANSILASWKELSDPGRTAAAQHLANLVADEQFQPVANILLDLKSSREVQDILFADILNRQDSVKWPLIMKVLETKDHPLSQEARTILTVVLGRDYGDDWSKWQDRVDRDLLKKGEAQP
jgi:hypothetical protein